MHIRQLQTARPCSMFSLSLNTALTIHIITRQSKQMTVTFSE